MLNNNNFLFDAQKHIAGILSSDQALSSIQIFAENSKDIDFQIKNALAKQGIVGVVMTPKCKYIGDYSLSAQIAYELDDMTVLFTEYTPMNRASNKTSCITAEDAATKAADILHFMDRGTFSIKEIVTFEQNELLNSKLTFKATIVDGDGAPPEPPKPSVNLISAEYDANGTYQPEEGTALSSVTVNVPQIELNSLQVTENDGYRAPEGKGFDYVEVNVLGNGFERVPNPNNDYINAVYLIRYNDTYFDKGIMQTEKLDDQGFYWNIKFMWNYIDYHMIIRNNNDYPLNVDDRYSYVPIWKIIENLIAEIYDIDGNLLDSRPIGYDKYSDGRLHLDWISDYVHGIDGEVQLIFLGSENRY